MKNAALIVTTGLPNVSGVNVLMRDVGGICAGHRMVAAFQSIGVSLIGLVVGPENKKVERELAGNGVIFLRSETENTDFYQGLKLGLSFLQGKFDRVFLVPGDTTLFLPTTLEAMLRSTASMVVPEYRHMHGYPILVDQQTLSRLLEQPDLPAAEELARSGALALASVGVNDPGIVIRGGDMTHRKHLIQRHNQQLSRPVMEVALRGSGTIYDQRLSMLLHLVEETRSVRDACSLMQISYSAAWNMLNQAEDVLGYPLVTRIRGGSAGSGSILTQKGKQLMDTYDRYSQRLHQEALSLFTEMFSSIPEPN